MNTDEKFELEAGDMHWADAFRDAAHSAAERPAHFWTAQRARIREGIAAKSRKRSAWLAFAYTAALCLFALMLVSKGHSPSGQTVQVAGLHVTHSASDQDLLAQVDATLDNSLPDALAPADILAKELDRNMQARSTTTRK